VVVLLMLELLLFWGYFSGEVSPAPDDFIGSYNNEPLAWWRDIRSTNLPDWVPYAWGGYPAALSIQSGSWYLPLGAATLLTPYSIHAAATLQALHVAFGALGVYVLGRRYSLGHIPSVFGLVAYFFATGFYTNGLHPDIVRGFAWAPWVFLCLSPSFPWHRRWGVPLAAIILWQAVVGSYPGVVVALVYAGAVVVVASQITRRPAVRQYLLPLGIAGVGASLLSAPKFFPALQLRGGASPTGLDDSVFSGQMWGTFFYPYDLESLPNDLSMRSFFIVAPVLVLLPLAWRHRTALSAPAAAALAAFGLGMPFLPWYELAAGLPGLDMSRFRMADFRVPLVVSLVLVAMIVLSRELTAARARTSSRIARLGLGAALAAVPVAALLAAVLGGYPVERWATPWVIVVASAVLVCQLVLHARAEHRQQSRAAALALVVLAGVSGVNWALDVTPPWRFPRAEVETSTWGTTSEALIAQYADDAELTQRPARTPLDDNAAPATDVHWNSSFYTGVDAVGGYVNLKGSQSFDAALVAVTSAETYFQSRTVLAAPGIGIEVADPTALPPVDAVVPCVVDGACGDGLTVHAAGYEPGHLRYAVESKHQTTVMFNESYYEGWSVRACSTDGTDCTDLEAERGAAGLMVVTMPQGTWDLEMDYQTPGKARDYAAFLLGLALIVGAGQWLGRSRHGRVDSSTTPTPGTDRD
jgi:hypothetical protein